MLNIDIIKNWKDKEISQLVIEYYEMFDLLNLTLGGLQQSLEEMTMVKQYLNGRKFKNFVELGYCDGGSLWMYGNMFCEVNSKIRGVDKINNPCTTLVARGLFQRGRNISLIQNKFENITEEFLDESIDLLHIDVDHDYAGVSNCFKLYYPKVAKGGVILIHDTEPEGDSRRFRKEVLEPNYNCRTFAGNYLVSGTYTEGVQIQQPGITLIIK